MNYRILAFYIFIIGFFGFLAFSYLHYEYSNHEKVSNTTAIHQDEIKEVVLNIIKENPEAIIASLTDYQLKQVKAEAEKANAIIKKYRKELEEGKNDQRFGNPKASVKIVEFFDYACGYCKKVQPFKERLLKEDEDVEIILKEFPIFGPSSVAASKIGLAIYKLDPDKYVKYHAEMMTSSGRKTEEQLFELAESLGIDKQKLQEALKDPQLDITLENNRKIASEIGIHGAPSFIINGELVNNFSNYEELKSKVVSARNKYTSDK